MSNKPIIIHSVNEDIFSVGATLLVNPVNVVGVMGKGLALSFKNRYPDMNTAYEIYCQYNYLSIGNNLYYYDDSGTTICCMATKEHWRHPSKVEYIVQGMNNLVEYINSTIEPIIVAIPKIGCGLGGLDWENTVKPIILTKLKDVCNNSTIHLLA